MVGNGNWTSWKFNIDTCLGNEVDVLPSVNKKATLTGFG